MHKRLFAATAISLSIPLSGCAGIGLFDFGKSSSQAQASRPHTDLSAYFDRRLADGKRHLTAGRLGLASEAFRQASYEPRHEAEAFNGLGIVYDRLGRTDLAERYFKAAVQLSPLEFRFARNLARFEGKELRLLLAKAEAAKTQGKTADTAEALALSAGAERSAKLEPAVSVRATKAVEREPRPIQKVAVRTLENEPRSLFEEAFPSPDMLFDKKVVQPEPQAQRLVAREMASTRSNEHAGKDRVALSADRTTVSKVYATAPSAVRPAEPEAGAIGTRVRVVRVSQNEIRLTRTVPAADETGTVVARNETTDRAAVVHIEKSSNGVVAISSDSSPETSLRLGSLANKIGAERTLTPLSLGAAWANCNSGC